MRSDSSTLGNRVAAELESRVLRGELRPNERLPTETELCELLGVSRSVVRDAIRTLSARGLIRVQQGVGMIVSEPSDVAVGEALAALLMRADVTMGDVVAARAALETALAPLAAERARPEDLKALAGALDDLGQAVVEKDWETAGEAHLAFHLGVLEAVRLPALTLLLKPIQEVIFFSSLPPRLEDPKLWEVPSHLPILDALRDRDPGRAREAMEEHFRYIDSKPYARFRTMPFRDVLAREEYVSFIAQIRGRPQPDGGRRVKR